MARKDTINPKLREAVNVIVNETKPQSLEDMQETIRNIVRCTVEAMCNKEMEAHLGFARHDQSPKATKNRRNGTSKKIVRSSQGEIELSLPRDREASFESLLIPKYCKDISGLDEKVISMYSFGMSTRDIAATIEEIYGFSLSAEKVSLITDAVNEEVQIWQNRPLKSAYPFLYIDALFADVKENRHSVKKAVYVIFGIDAEGYKDVLGFWCRDTEGAKEWLNIFESLKARGVRNLTFVSADGLRGIEEAIHAAFGPSVIYQRCIVHIVRNSLKYVPAKHRKEFCNDLKSFYAAMQIEQAQVNYEAFIEKWENKYPGATKVWQQNYRFVEQLFDYPPAIRKLIYTTNIVESVNAALRKVTNNKGALPNVEALTKLLYLRIQNLTKKWTHCIRDWATIRGQLDILRPGWDDVGNE